jgi:uncharacterized protein YybS (DUF2232 family)
MTTQRGLYIVLASFAGYVCFGSYVALGFAAIFVNLFTPLPAAFGGMRYGPTTGGLIVVCTFAIVLFTQGPVQGVMYLIQFGIPGALLPWLLIRGLAWDKSVLMVIGAMVGVSLVSLVLISSSAGESPLAMTNKLITDEISQTRTLLGEMFDEAELPADQRREVTEAVDNMAAFMLKAYPGIVITVGGLMVLSLVVLLAFLARGKYRIPGTPFPQWKAPEIFVWILIPSGFLVAFTEGGGATFGLNVLVILLPVYFVQGLAVIDCFFRRKAFSPVIRAIGYLLVTLVNPLPLLVTGIGVFDLWADFRKPRENKS